MMSLHCVRIHSRKGMGEVLTTILAIPLFAVVIGFLAYFGRALYVQGAIEAAASAGARFAVTSLSGEKGCKQATEAVVRVLEGYTLDPAGAQITVRPIAGWDRGMRAEVLLTYRVPQLPGLYFSRLLGDPLVRTRYVVVIDRYNNRFSNGWLPCISAPANEVMQ